MSPQPRPSRVRRGAATTLFFAAFAALAGLAMTCTTKGTSDAGSPPALLELPAWRGLTAEYGDRFELRRETEGGGALLLWHSRRDSVYRYDPAARTLSLVTQAEWRRATGAVAECAAQFVRAEGLRVDKSHKLFAGERELRAAGPTVLELAEAPSGRWLAVLSAKGAPAASVLPFSAGGGAAGQYYHQTLALPAASWHGQPVPVPTRRDYENLIPCWSADEQFVIYRQIDFDYLSVVETGPPPSASNSPKVSQ